MCHAAAQANSKSRQPRALRVDMFGRRASRTAIGEITVRVCTNVRADSLMRSASALYRCRCSARFS